jgi:hypothetical protein
MRASLDCFLQGVRIALQRFEEAADWSYPSGAIPAELTRSLQIARGWSLVMCGKTNQAEPFLQNARDLSKVDKQRSIGYLYLLNISALNRFKLGDIECALEMEKEIESSHSMLPSRDWQLEYVNSINMARIYRHLRKLNCLNTITYAHFQLT